MISIEKAERLRKLHRGPGVLVLPNAWDAASARVFEVAGFEAIGTTSAGVSYSLGYADGENVPREEMLAATARITRRVAVPVTADIEAGFGESLEELAATIRAVIEAGAVGVNLEDTASGGKKLADLDVAMNRIRVVRATAAAMGVPVVLNARTEVYLLGLNDFRLAVDRLNAFRDAGADCLFAPGVVKSEAIAAIVKEVRGPVNILAVRGTPPIAELQAMGVRRVSVGSGPCRATMALTQEIANELRSQGTYESFTARTIPYPDVNRMMKR
jgi:2-methylisocitrate lyase-like PEP mutase family enzyme